MTIIFVTDISTENLSQQQWRSIYPVSNVFRQLLQCLHVVNGYGTEITCGSGLEQLGI